MESCGLDRQEKKKEDQEQIHFIEYMNIHGLKVSLMCGWLREMGKRSRQSTNQMDVKQKESKTLKRMSCQQKPFNLLILVLYSGHFFTGEGGLRIQRVSCTRNKSSIYLFGNRNDRRLRVLNSKLVAHQLYHPAEPPILIMINFKSQGIWQEKQKLNSHPIFIFHRLHKSGSRFWGNRTSSKLYGSSRE